jgi:hypothetical protein
VVKEYTANEFFKRKWVVDEKKKVITEKKKKSIKRYNIIRIGNSLGIIIPKKILKKFNVGLGDSIRIKILR